MQQPRRKIILAILLSAWANGTADVHAADIAQTAASMPAAEPDWDELLKGLASTDFATRENAQKEMIQVGYAYRETVSKFIDTQADEEVKIRLLACLDAIDEHLAVDPGPITLQIKNASPDVLGGALSKRLGLPVKVGPSGREGFYTLDLVHKPYWEVFASLSQQQPFFLQTAAPRESERALASSWTLRQYDAHQGFIAFAQGVTLSRRVDAQMGGTSETQLVFQYTVAADPRIKVIQTSRPRLVQVVDEAGTSLRNDAAAAESPLNVNFQNFWAAAVSLHIPAKMGKKIAEVRGDQQFVVQVRSARVEMEDVAKHVGETTRVGDQNIAVARFDLAPDSLQLQLAAKPIRPLPNQRMEYSLFDSEGKLIWNVVAEGGSTATVAGQFKGPFKLAVAAQEKSKSVSIQFEFKDIPLP